LVGHGSISSAFVAANHFCVPVVSKHGMSLLHSGSYLLASITMVSQLASAILLTLSLSKSTSIFHVSLGENARLAREAGDTAGEEYWSGLVAEVDDMIWRAVHAGFGYFQREAGYTRTGSHSKRVNGRETGQWHEADLAVAHWLQHVSRDGDMQLHVHSQIAHVARASTDGKWRAPDSLGYNEHIGAVGAITAQHLEEALTARFGLQWTWHESHDS
jgi:TrwC relaxase